MDKRKLYDLAINALIFNRLYVNSEWYGNFIYWGRSVHISKCILSDDLCVAFIDRYWTIRKYDS